MFDASLTHLSGLCVQPLGSLSKNSILTVLYHPDFGLVKAD